MMVHYDYPRIKFVYPIHSMLSYIDVGMRARLQKSNIVRPELCAAAFKTERPILLSFSQ